MMRPEQVSDWASLARFLTEQQQTAQGVMQDEGVAPTPAFEPAPGQASPVRQRIEENRRLGFEPDAFDLQELELEEAEAIMARPTTASPAIAAGYDQPPQPQRDFAPEQLPVPPTPDPLGRGQAAIPAEQLRAPAPRLGGPGASEPMAQRPPQGNRRVQLDAPVVIPRQADEERAATEQILESNGMGSPEFQSQREADAATQQWRQGLGDGTAPTGVQVPGIGAIRAPEPDPNAPPPGFRRIEGAPPPELTTPSGGAQGNPMQPGMLGFDPGAVPQGPAGPARRPRPGVLPTPAGPVPVVPGSQTQVQYNLRTGGGGPHVRTEAETELHPAVNPADVGALGEASLDVRKRTYDVMQGQRAMEGEREQLTDDIYEDRTEQQGEEQQHREQAEDSARQQMQQHEQVVRQVREMRNDPSRFFSTRTGLGMFGAALALAMADVTPGRGAALIQHLIDNEIAAQAEDMQHARAGVGASENLVGMMRRLHGDVALGDEAARHALLERYQMEAESMAARHRGTDLGNRAELMDAELRQQAAQNRIAIQQGAMTVRQRQVQTTGGGGTNVRVTQSVPVESEGSPGGQRVAASIQRAIAENDQAARDLLALADRVEQFDPGLFTGTFFGSDEGLMLMEEFERVRGNLLRANAGLQQTEGEARREADRMVDVSSWMTRLRRGPQYMASSLRARARNVAQFGRLLRETSGAGETSASRETDVQTSTEMETAEQAGAADREE